MIPNNIVARIVFVVLAAGVVLSFFLTFLGGKVFSVPTVSVLHRIGTSWFFILIYLTMIFLLLDLLKVTHLVPVHQLMYRSWLGLGLLTGIITIVMSGGYIHYLHKKRTALEIVVDKQNTENKTLKIVAMSDLHLGYGIGREEFRHWIELVNKENPDVLLLVGDVIDNDLRPLYYWQMAEMFHSIQTKHGIYAVYGNHEYISNPQKSAAFFREAGIVTLRDSSVLLDNSVYITGRDDRSNPHRKSIKELTQNFDRDKPIILLDHQPYCLDDVAKNNIDLQLSGHTHYGQVFPLSWITKCIYEKAYGYLKKGNSHIYVTSGIGLWGGKFRIGTHSEYVVIDFVVQ
jgi:predicted MPP superfamily phosphohydrolase